ncbi:hypothetical protein [Microvirga aerophila]|uniref:Uncharacterized protein n=1 Tax=Microvirga aerophila TaxID=670291 RepID=A0A512BWN7_9HYPH|nr:hypothetical protein [Microvirga aerophila]GEO16345.1 hypothetical protein MAE02_40410 [Microvirga aerophila]
MLQHLLMALLFGALSVYGLVLTVGTAALGMIESRIPAVLPNQQATSEDLAKDLEVWSSIPGLGDRATSLAVRLAQATVEPEHIEELGRRIEDKLKQRPASPSYWLLLAYVRFVRSEPVPLVTKALENSILTGRYERHVMIERVRFAFLIWPLLTPDLQRQMTSELAHVGGHLNRETLSELRTSLASLPAEERDTMALTLQTRLGTTEPGWVKALDLAPRSPT